MLLKHLWIFNHRIQITWEAPEVSYYRRNLSRARRVHIMDKTTEPQGTAALSTLLSHFPVFFFHFMYALFWASKNLFGQVNFVYLLVHGLVENFGISTALYIDRHGHTGIWSSFDSHKILFAGNIRLNRINMLLGNTNQYMCRKQTPLLFY